MNLKRLRGGLRPALVGAAVALAVALPLTLGGDEGPRIRGSSLIALGTPVTYDYPALSQATISGGQLLPGEAQLQTLNGSLTITSEGLRASASRYARARWHLDSPPIAAGERMELEARLTLAGGSGYYRPLWTDSGPPISSGQETRVMLVRHGGDKRYHFYTEHEGFQRLNCWDEPSIGYLPTTRPLDFSIVVVPSKGSDGLRVLQVADGGNLLVSATCSGPSYPSSVPAAEVQIRRVGFGVDGASSTQTVIVASASLTVGESLPPPPPPPEETCDQACVAGYEAQIDALGAQVASLSAELAEWQSWYAEAP